MLPAKALIPAWTGIRITAAGPLLNSTGFPFKRCCTCVAHSLQKKTYKINFFISLLPDSLPDWNSFAGGNCIFQVNIVIFLLCRSGGTGRHARLRGVWATMRVRVPPSAPFPSFKIKEFKSVILHNHGVQTVYSFNLPLFFRAPFLLM